MTINKQLFGPLFLLGLNGLLAAAAGQPNGPWRLAFKVVSGKWDEAVTGTSTFWELFTSDNSYSSSNVVQDQRDFTTTSDHYKSTLVQKWADHTISVQAVKLSFFKNNLEKAFVVFDGVGKTKTTWFKCDNILYSSYTDLPDNTLAAECGGKSSSLPLTMMKVSYLQAQCSDTTGWTVVADTNLGFSLCQDSYLPANGPEPYFKYSKLSTVADLTTELETADSIGIFFQVWDMVFKGVEGIKPSDASLGNLTGLYLSDTATENDNSDNTVQNLQHSQTTTTFKSSLINTWANYHIDQVKYSMLKSGIEKAYVVFDGTNSDRTSWLNPDNIMYSSYGDTLTSGTSLDVCSIEGDSYRNWQIQSVADLAGCSNTEQQGWMLIKEPKNNGSCTWDTNTLKKKPYFLYNTGIAPDNPVNFQYADVMAVFVQGWRLVFKLSAGGSISPKSSVYTLWSEVGTLNEEVATATELTAGSEGYKSSIVDQWSNLYIHAVKIAAYKDGVEVFHAVFDATASSSTDWLDCDRLLYTSVAGLDRTTSYSCFVDEASSVFRFQIGTSPDCAATTMTGVFGVIDVDSTCSSRQDLPQFVFSNTLDSSLTDSTSSQLADVFAIFLAMDNCNDGPCQNGATCKDLGGNFRCFCTGSYYGNTCANLDGTYEVWSAWSGCSVTCGAGSQTRTRVCSGTEGAGVCDGASEETMACTLDLCPVDGGFTDFSDWSVCTKSCETGSQTRTRTCTNPAPQNGGADCVGDLEETQDCNTDPCPIDGGLTEWTDWGICTQTCGAGTQIRTRTCDNPAPQNGGIDCTGDLEESQVCNETPCPVDGVYTIWTEWSECSKTCETGTQLRTRECTNPAPQNGGADCVGDATENRDCNTDPCPINGGLSEWSVWGTCSVTCGIGSSIRTRTCSNPAPANGGLDCTADLSENQACVLNPCPVDGVYTDWTEWSTCTVTCNTGSRERTRTCTPPQNGGQECSGEATETENCNTDTCPAVDGVWSDWSGWSTCSVTCGGGTQTRSRDCTDPQHGGAPCVGDGTESMSCGTDNCPVDGVLTPWTEWSVCTKACDQGIHSRTRTCDGPYDGGSDCTGGLSEIGLCNIDPCPPVNGEWSPWLEWSTCTRTCEGGDHTRTRMCDNPEASNGGLPCNGSHSETKHCNVDPCPVDGEFGPWGNWSMCYNMTNYNCTSECDCGTGVHTRDRPCDSPTPAFGGQECSGNNIDTQVCKITCYELVCDPEFPHDPEKCEMVPVGEPDNSGADTGPMVILHLVMVLCTVIVNIM